MLPPTVKRGMIVAVKDHQRKSHGIVQALRSQGWWVVPPGTPANVLLIDMDVERPGCREMIVAYKDVFGARIVIYPHGSNSGSYWDGISEPYPVDACWVIGEAQRDMMLAYGYPYSVQVIGWSFCEQRPFRPGPTDRQPRVLFAPIHPLGNGYMHPDYKQANADAYRRILDWQLPVTIRHIGPLELNGLWEEPNVEYEPGLMNTSHDSIDAHDLVVAVGTFHALAVARGVPAIIYHQVVPNSDPHDPSEPMVLAANWDTYADIVRYPYDIGDPDPLRALEREASDWRARFIGGQLDPQAVSAMLTAICEREQVPA